MSHYHKRTKREFTGSKALCFNERETLNGIKFPQSLRADHLTLEGGAGGWFWKKFPASARRKKKIACTTNVIESLWEKKGKNVLLTSNLLRWQRPKRESNAHKSKLPWNDISKLCLFIYFFFCSKLCLFSWHLVALSWEDAEGFYWKYSTMQSYKLCGHSTGTLSHFYVSRSLKELTFLCHGETFQCIKFLAFIAR